MCHWGYHKFIQLASVTLANSTLYVLCFEMLKPVCLEIKLVSFLTYPFLP